MSLNVSLPKGGMMAEDKLEPPVPTAASLDVLNYTHKQVKSSTNHQALKPFEDLRRAALTKLTSEIRYFLPSFDPENKSKVQEKITPLLPAQQAWLDLYVSYKELTFMEIPQEQGPKLYAPLPDSVGGVTAKITLISMEAISEKLTRFLDHPGPFEPADFKLKPDAILKLPKHGKKTEVQREAIALNIARILRLNTTQSTMVTYGGEPALFVPFAKIALLKDFARGKPVSDYVNYSTIQPVGEGLQSDQCIEDFGAALGLLYLCNDPDSIGKLNQNKALSESRFLYIFDQVIMLENNFTLDSRMSLSSVSWFRSQSRHTEGRNKTLVEDSIINAKVDSIANLIRNGDAIIQMINGIIKTHEAELNHTPYGEKYTELVALRDDAMELRTAVRTRMEEVFKAFPLMNGRPIGLSVVNNEEKLGILKRTILLEKMFNKPRLFADDGRVYRNLWTEPHELKIINVRIEGEEVFIEWNKSIKPELISHYFKKELKSIDKTHTKMSLHDFKNLSETAFFPENEHQFNPTCKYLDMNRIQHLSKHYKAGHRTQILEALNQYNHIMDSASQTPEKKIASMLQTMDTIIGYTREAKDKGFLNHALRILQFDIQHRLQSMIADEELKAMLTQAFDAAIKLDRISLFNQVLMKAITTKQLADPEFREYLEDCIKLSTESNNYEQSKFNSHDMSLTSDSLIKKLDKRLQVEAKKEASPLVNLSIYAPPKKDKDTSSPATDPNPKFN